MIHVCVAQYEADDDGDESEHHGKLFTEIMDGINRSLGLNVAVSLSERPMTSCTELSVVLIIVFFSMEQVHFPWPIPRKDIAKHKFFWE